MLSLLLLKEQYFYALFTFCLQFFFFKFFLNRTNKFGDGCKILNWNYTEMGSMNFNDAMNYSHSHHQPDSISCKQKQNNYFHYEQEPNISIVPEVSNSIQSNIMLLIIIIIISC